MHETAYLPSHFPEPEAAIFLNLSSGQHMGKLFELGQQRLKATAIKNVIQLKKHPDPDGVSTTGSKPAQTRSLTAPSKDGTQVMSPSATWLWIQQVKDFHNVYFTVRLFRSICPQQNQMIC